MSVSHTYRDRLDVAYLAGIVNFWHSSGIKSGRRITKTGFKQKKEGGKYTSEVVSLKGLVVQK